MVEEDVDDEPVVEEPEVVDGQPSERADGAVGAVAADHASGDDLRTVGVAHHDRALHSHVTSVPNFGKAGPIESFRPMILFAIMFGLSMDYEVFLLSRMKEEYDTNGHDNREAVASGLAGTARVITAAAAIMARVFGSLLFGDGLTAKEFGLGLAVAVRVDATVVRMILVPAAMALLGDVNW